MDESKTQAITVAASAIFRRYGIARTTMGDIARAAGISRPALYLVFPNKESVFQAVAHYLTDGALETMRSGLAGCPSLEERLKLVCYGWGASSYDLIQVHPDAIDMFDLSLPVIQETHQKFQNFIAELLEDAVSRSSTALTAQELARTLVFALRGIMEGARDAADVRRMIDVQVALVVRALGDR